MSLRDYQSECVESTIEKFNEGKRKLLAVLPTGGGKTIIFSHLAKKNLDGCFWGKPADSHFKIPQPGRTLILAHREELIDQAIEKLWNSTGIEAGREKAEDKAELSAPVVVASIQTLIREKRRSRWPADHFSLIVVDEAHHVLADSYQNVLGYFDPFARILGVTATPDRGDRRNLGKYFEDKAYEITLLELINRGYLSRIKIKTIPISIDLTGVRTEKGDYDANDLDAHLSRYLLEIANAIRDQAPFRKVLIFCPLIKTSLAMRDALRSIGIAAEHVDGTSEDRAEILDRFEKNKFDVLCNAMLLTEGYDCPDVDCVVVLRPTKVRALYSQMIGRGTRIARGKDHLLLLDFLWMHERHDLVKPAHLIASSERAAETMQKIAEKGGEIELEELQSRAIDKITEEVEAESEAKKQREKTMIDSIKENAGKGKKFIDAMEFSMSLHDVDALDFVPTFDWEMDAPSEKQLMAIAKAGIDPATVTCKGIAGRILDRINARRAAHLATPKQMNMLKRFKHPNPELVTFAEASELLDQYFGQREQRTVFTRVS